MYTILAFLSAIGLRVDLHYLRLSLREVNRKSQKLSSFAKMVEKYGIHIYMYLLTCIP